MKFRRGSAMHPVMDEDIVYSIWKHIAKCTKNRDFGETGYIICEYDPVNRRIYQKNLGDRVVYGWDHTGIKEPEDRAIDLDEFQVREAETPPF